MPVDPITMSAVSAILWLGEKIASSIIEPAIKEHVGPLVREKAEQAWIRARSLFADGDIEAATAVIEENGLTQVVQEAAVALKERVLVLEPPLMANPYPERVAVLGKIIDFLFETAAAWKMDLVLRGTLIGPQGLTIVRSSPRELMRQYFIPIKRPKISHPLFRGGHQVMWLDRLDTEREVDEVIQGFRLKVREARAKDDAAYVKADPPKLRPALYVTGLEVTVAGFREEREEEMFNMVGGAKFGSVKSLPIGDWPAGVRSIMASLDEMTTMLELAPKEQEILGNWTALAKNLVARA